MRIVPLPFGPGPNKLRAYSFLSQDKVSTSEPSLHAVINVSSTPTRADAKRMEAGPYTPKADTFGAAARCTTSQPEKQDLLTSPIQLKRTHLHPRERPSNTPASLRQISLAMKQFNPFIAVIFPVTAFSVLSVIYMSFAALGIRGPLAQTPHYSYIGDDYPHLFNGTLAPVEMTFEDTVRYQLGDRVSRAEWLSLRVPWSHLGYLRLGTERRLLAVALFHQLHCMDILARGVADDDKEAARHHIQHCLNYLRQLFICSADTMLEPYDFEARVNSFRPAEVTRTCRDWSAVYAAAEMNHREWVG